MQILGDFVDSYRNLSYKNIFGKLWASSYCPQVCNRKEKLTPGDFTVKSTAILKALSTT